jgi:hypothetical protein
MVKQFRDLAGSDKPVHGGVKVAYAETRDEGIEHAHRLWSTSGLPGELGQVLPSPKHFEQASALVTHEMTAEKVTAGPDAADHIEVFRPYAEAGFDAVHVANMGPHYRAMIKMYGDAVLPEVRRLFGS